jgi:thioredoxin-related protein
MKIISLMKKYWWIAIGIVAVSVAFFSWTTKTEPEETAEASGIKWMRYEEAVKLNKKKKKKYLVDVYTDWCGWCKVMDKQTFTDPAIIKYVNEKFYAVKLNAEKDTATIYQGNPTKDNILATQVFRASGYPTTVVLEEEQNLLLSQPGFLNAEVMDKVLHYYGEDAYKTQTWEQFQATYVKE